MSAEVGVPDILTGALAVWLMHPPIRFRLPLYSVFLVLIAARMYWLGDAAIRAWENALSWRGAAWGYVLRMLFLIATFLALASVAKTMDRPASVPPTKPRREV